MAKKATKKNNNNNIRRLLELFRKDRAHFLTGVSVAFIGAYFFLAQVSFLFTGAPDQSKVLNRSFWEIITEKQDIANWTGVAGAFIAEKFINGWFGIFSFAIPIFLIFAGLRLMKIIRVSILKSFLISSFFLIWGSIFSAFIFGHLPGNSHILWGGGHGEYIDGLLETTLGIPGTIMILLLLIVIFTIIVKKSSIDFFRKPFNKKQEDESDINYNHNTTEDNVLDIEKKPSLWMRLKNLLKKKPVAVQEEDNKDEEENDFVVNSVQNKETDHSADDDFEIVVAQDEEEYIAPKKGNDNKLKNNPVNEEQNNENEIGEGEEMEDYDPTKDLSNFHFPEPDLLKVYDSTGKGVNMEEQNANKSKIINTLQNYGIEITSIKATVGPTITLYEIVPKAGVRISKIRNLEDDIALSLSALGIRIIAPMPGKGTIGIEVPNKDAQIVSMQSVIGSRKFQECTYDLPVALGKTITNDVFIFDLCKMPHLLVAGATGQGKSVGLNAIITSLLYKKHPAEMKMVLVDPKMVEFNIYSRIEKHYLAKLPDAEKAIITDVTKVTQTLNSLTKEMDDRYELLMEAGVRNIKEYNEKFRKRRLNPLKGHRFMPYLVIIIDEFGDLIMTAGKEIEMPIARIAQKARAVGMHMIIATQRPTTNIITGTIKANFPARMAFRVTSQIDSRTILDMSGANQLIGRGDMLFSQGSDLVRIQCAFVDTPEVEGIAEYIGKQQGYASAFELPEYVGEGSEDKVGGVDLSDRDPLFDEAARLIVVHQQGSTSLIQRKFSIGYNRAGRLMDQLEAAGIVGPTQGSKPRDVLIADEYSLEQKLSSLG